MWPMGSDVANQTLQLVKQHNLFCYEILCNVNHLREDVRLGSVRAAAMVVWGWGVWR
jgi:hypothetical protein